MKILVAAGVLVLGSVTLWIRTPSGEAPLPLVRKSIPAWTPAVAVRSDAESALGNPESPAPSAGPAPLPSAASPTSPVGASEERESDRAERVLVLSHLLGLSAEQRVAVGKILKERDDEVEVLHGEIRRSGVLFIWGHDRKAREILARSHQRIAALLSEEQAQRFFQSLESGSLAEGISFEVTPGMTVVR